MRRQKYIILPCCLLFSYWIQCESQAQNTTNPNGSTAVAETSDSAASIKQWFEQYDQIRRSAEMTLVEKLQAKNFLDRGLKSLLGKRDEALSKRMIVKYATAEAELRKLPKLADTQELQEGYIEFFKRMHQLFVDRVNEQGNPNITPETVACAKKELQELTRRNGKLDQELREKYQIPKHKHI